MSRINKGYAIVPLVEDMINRVDNDRTIYTKRLIVSTTLHSTLFISILLAGLVLHQYEIIPSIIANFVIALVCISRFRAFNDELENSYMTARNALYGDDYKDVYLNEEKMMMTYGDLREMVRYVNECIRTDNIINVITFAFELAYILLIIIN